MEGAEIRPDQGWRSTAKARVIHLPSRRIGIAKVAKRERESAEEKPAKEVFRLASWWNKARDREVRSGQGQDKQSEGQRCCGRAWRTQRPGIEGV